MGFGLWIKWWSVKDIEVDCINIGSVDVGMEDNLFLRRGIIGFFRRIVILLRRIRELALDHQNALAHDRVEFDILYNLRAFKFGGGHGGQSSRPRLCVACLSVPSLSIAVRRSQCPQRWPPPEAESLP